MVTGEVARSWGGGASTVRPKFMNANRRAKTPNRTWTLDVLPFSGFCPHIYWVYPKKVRHPGPKYTGIVFP